MPFSPIPPKVRSFQVGASFSYQAIITKFSSFPTKAKAQDKEGWMAKELFPLNIGGLEVRSIFQSVLLPMVPLSRKSAVKGLHRLTVVLEKPLRRAGSHHLVLLPPDPAMINHNSSPPA